MKKAKISLNQPVSPKVTALTFGILVLLFSLSFYVWAWTEPSTAPPGGNVPAPLNVGSGGQYKIGRIQIGNSATSWINDSISAFSEPVVSNDGFIFIGGYTGAEDSDLRLYMLDNAAERFSIWGDSCGGGNCGELNAASLEHYFTAGGDAWHKNKMTAAQICIEGQGCKSDWSDIAGAGYWTQSGSKLYPNNAGWNVGIGTTDANSKLRVYGGHLRVDGGGEYQSWGWLTLHPDWDNTGDDVVRFVNSTGGENMRIDEAGNVGIGTTNPGKKLEVYTSGWKARFGGPDGYIDIGPANSGWAHIYTDRPKIIFNKDVYTTSNAFSSYNSDLVLKTQGTERMRIKTNGNVGIGTAGPDNKLEVNGAIEIQVDNADNKLRFHDPGQYWYSMGIDRSDGGKFKIGRGGNVGDNNDFVMSGGNVGIGTAGPGDKLHVEGGQVTIRNAAPTIRLRDTNNYAGFIHQNSNWLYFLSSAGPDATGWTRHGSYWPLRINMANDNIEIGGNVYVREGTLDMNNNKIANVLEIDPVFGIEGKKYVTYMPDFIGQKVEVVGQAQLEGGKLEIDLEKEPEGSDLWLFWQVVDRESIIPFVTPQDNASLYAFIDGSKLVVKLKDGKENAKFSYRLIATRLDHAGDSNNLYEDQTVESYIDIDALRK